MKWGLGSITQRVALVSLVLAAVIAGAVIYTQRLVDQSSQKSKVTIAENQQIQVALNSLRTSLLSLEQSIYQLSLLQDRHQQERLLALSNSVVFQSSGLLNTPVAQRSAPIQKVVKTMAEDLHRLQGESRSLITVMSSAGTFYPGMPILTEKLYPANIAFMQAVELAILEAESLIRQPEQREILGILKEIKYAWVLAASTGGDRLTFCHSSKLLQRCRPSAKNASLRSCASQTVRPKTMCFPSAANVNVNPV